ncbi:endonuclease/exonuclease/phosphatase family protein [Gimesia chilikensis]|uniref:endonuclease/exonuclease/phosphatase family protein n=1 Tax=Gimesia chilikensis TaxID=2605989 RepID=UPI0011EF3121|nr:endonuclease/exonuclease/phosphatase family protein [Gimesia chilikensis]KAA0132095.1 endonuclease/exonuclease/phosphatase family protein [Gimesia chilikensis]
MLRCLFWNQHRKDLSDVVGAAAATLRPDILVFCETGAPSHRTINALSGTDAYHFTTGRVGNRFHIFTRFNKHFIGIRSEADRYLILDINLPARDRFLLMVLHAPSKIVGWDTTSLALEITQYVAALRKAQDKYDLPRCVVVGDFNMNPFEPGMVGANAFNAVMDARQAKKGSRVVQNQRYEYFYNPMWNLLGDHSPGPPATLYYDAHTQNEQHWHMLDQVIISPAMIDHFDVKSLRILEEIGDYNLLTAEGRPRSAKFSDHLPLYFELMV